ncbi:MAG: tRNA (adenosine(37)-N6)-threonylcarbamoyltransferase complex transferase subunit TsaD [Candidatus Omnitrophica bacterium]|nr:tRNA (adenosine(37)-N6)-threonylcarbamoyltransferase complex transferase subunit TsaD [Candidatus Omnitrophota bacterium]MCG2703410.1 tRNA (adenosine(37)-N6)-threonylcarbamoyltransferase complex transferase subunit TsaD [Candidatus Omnitrophota bacterium]
MYTLGIETSCDETAAAVIKNSATVLSSCVSSSVHIHNKFGGIVPEIASRFHLEYITAVTRQALAKANITLPDIGLIAVTSRPGLVGSLLVGVSFAKTLAFSLHKPLIGVNHINAHLFAPFLKKQRFLFPFIGLVVSGGHTSLALVRDFNKIKIIGKTRDDAAGEAFDKTAKILGLGYPGGPVIDKLAKTVSASPFQFSCAQLNDSLDFSFSGIKTNVLYTYQKIKQKNRLTKAHIAHAFEHEVVNTIVSKSIRACKKQRLRLLSAGGGVACNSLLRTQLTQACKREKITLLLAEPHFCLDNAAMIAALGYRLFKKGIRSKYSLTASANT